MLLFSIVVPVYNVEKYLEECIESIIGQTYSGWELILVDDGSTDKSNEICKRYIEKDFRVKLFEKENSGQADSRNYGVEQATGNYLLFVDSDDYISPYALQNCSSECLKWNMPDVIITEGMYEVWSEAITEDRQWEACDYKGLSGRDTLVKTMRKAPNWSPCGKCYRLDFWRGHNFMFPTKRLAEDFALIDRVVLEAECVSMIPSFYYYRRFRDNSTMTSGSKRLKYDELLNLIDWDEFLKQREPDNELIYAFKRTFAVLYCHDILGNLYLFRGKEKADVLKKTRGLIQYLDYADGKEEKAIRVLTKIIGLRGTAFLTGIIKRYRIRREKKKYLESNNAR